MWHAGLIHHNKVKPFLVRITQHNPVLYVSTSYKLKYALFDYFINYDAIQYAWADRLLGPHTSDHELKRGKEKMIKHDPI